MGTRYLTAVVKDNEYKVAQYGQFDGYPDHAGVEVLNFLKDTMQDEDYFSDKMDCLIFISNEELAKKWEDLGADGSGYVSLETSNKFFSVYPHLHRNTGAEVLEVIYKSPDLEGVKFELIDNLSFASDSLFCEWAYVIDLDKRVFEVYEGFNNESPLDESDRFFFLQEKHSDYYPVKIKHPFSLDSLPAESNFLDYLSKSED